jgi:hypothetical protein
LAYMISVQASRVKRSSTAFLQVVIVLIALGAAALLLVKPWVDGRKAHATAFAIYFKDLFLAFVYAMSIPFFVALYHAFKVLGYAGRNQVFSEPAVRSMRTIKRCALVIVGFVVFGEVFVLKHDDAENPGAGVFIGLLVIFPSVVIAAAAAVFERVLRSAVDIKSENDLTV